MRTTRRLSLLIVCLGLLVVIGACSAGGSPVIPDPQDNLSNYASSVTGFLYKGGGPVAEGHVYVYDLSTFKLFNKADVKSDGSYAVGVDEGQYLLFAFGPDGWNPPQIEADFSNYINVEKDFDYRADFDLTMNLPAGEDLLFGLVTSSDNSFPIPGATVSAAGRTTKTDGYGFYVLAVPEGTSNVTVSAEGFFDLTTNIREGQAVDNYYDTPFFMLTPINPMGASIGGVIRDVFDGTGLGGVRVTLTLPALVNFEPIRYMTNLGGQYRFYNLPEAIYRLYFERPGYVSGSRDGLVIKDQDEVIINVFLHRDLTATAHLWGYVNAAGIPLPVNGARVTATNPYLGSYKATTNPTGYYSLDNVIPGNYTMSVVTPGVGVTFYEATSTFQTVVTGENQVNFALRFVNEGVLRGTVTIDGGGSGTFAFPPTGVEVTAEKVGGSLSGVKWRTTTDGKGQFVFNGVPFGLYKVDGSIEYETFEKFTGTMYNVPVNSGQTTNVDLVLAIN